MNGDRDAPPDTVGDSSFAAFRNRLGKILGGNGERESYSCSGGGREDLSIFPPIILIANIILVETFR